MGDSILNPGLEEKNVAIKYNVETVSEIQYSCILDTVISKGEWLNLVEVIFLNYYFKKIIFN